MYIKEITASLYAWDCADEGVKNIVDCLEERCKINSLYLVGIMHHEKRPLTSLFYTHNPARKLYIPEDSRLYYKFDPDNFKGLKLQPLAPDNELVKGTDWLDVTTDEARRRNMRAGVELSHTLFDTGIAMAEHPDIMQLDVECKRSCLEPQLLSAICCVSRYDDK